MGQPVQVGKRKRDRRDPAGHPRPPRLHFPVQGRQARQAARYHGQAGRPLGAPPAFTGLSCHHCLPVTRPAQRRLGTTSRLQPTRPAQPGARALRPMCPRPTARLRLKPVCQRQRNLDPLAMPRRGQYSPAVDTVPGARPGHQDLGLPGNSAADSNGYACPRRGTAALYLVLPALIKVLGAWPRLSTLNPVWFMVGLPVTPGRPGRRGGLPQRPGSRAMDRCPGAPLSLTELAQSCNRRR